MILTLDSAICMSRFWRFSIKQVKSVTKADKLANTVIQLEAELRLKTDAFNQVDACDSVIYDDQEKSFRTADSTFEDSLMMQNTCGIWLLNKSSSKSIRIL